MPTRACQLLLVASLGWLSWLGMMGVHELGHALGAWATGGQVQRIVWRPGVISRTDVDPNPRPLAVVWAGPAAGAAGPGLVYAAACVLQWPGRGVLGFFAGFCLIANGAYIGVGAFEGVADAGVMLRLGSPRWALVLFGLVLAPLGLWVWHRESGRFGFGRRRRAPGGAAALGAFAAAAAVTAAGWVLGDPG